MTLSWFREPVTLSFSKMTHSGENMAWFNTKRKREFHCDFQNYLQQHSSFPTLSGCILSPKHQNKITSELCLLLTELGEAETTHSHKALAAYDMEVPLQRDKPAIEPVNVLKCNLPNNVKRITGKSQHSTQIQ